MENQLVAKKPVNRIRLNLKCLAVAALLLLQLILEMVTLNTYLDEVIGVLSIVIIVLNVIKGKIDNYDIKTLFLILAVVLIGLLSNAIFGINGSVFSILVDTLTQIKVLMVFFAIRYFLNEKERQTVISYLTPYAALFLFIAFLFSIINQMADIGMSGGYRYGIKIFKFVFAFNHQYAASAIFCFGVVICNKQLNNNIKKVFYVIGIISILAALKTLSMIFPFVWIALTIYFSRYKRVNALIIIASFIFIFLLGRYQINEYLLVASSPRRVFFDYAIKDANEHFPLGSGFGTFGSAEAAKNYSQLYYQYGFHHRWGMSPEYKAFLHDNYWQGAIGQLGWLGFLLFITAYIRIFICGVSTESAPYRRAFQIAVYAAIMVFAIGSAAISSAPGLLSFAIFSLSSENSKEKIKKNQRLKIRIIT